MFLLIKIAQAISSMIHSNRFDRPTTLPYSFSALNENTGHGNPPIGGHCNNSPRVYLDEDILRMRCDQHPEHSTLCTTGQDRLLLR